MSVAAVRPVVWRIEQVLYERLQTLLAGVDPFYLASEVIQPTRINTYTPKDRQIVLLRGSEERLPELDCFGNPPAIAKKQTWNVIAHALPSEHDTRPVNEHRDVAAAALQKVVAFNAGARWYTFGELANNAELGEVAAIETDGSFTGVLLPVMVTYKTDEGNPYTVRA